MKKDHDGFAGLTEQSGARGVASTQPIKGRKMLRLNLRQAEGHDDAEICRLGGLFLVQKNRLKILNAEFDILAREFEAKSPAKPPALRVQEADRLLFLGIPRSEGEFYSSCAIEWLRNPAFYRGVGREASRSAGVRDPQIAKYWETHGRGPIVPVVEAWTEANHRAIEVCAAADDFECSKKLLCEKIGIKTTLKEIASVEREIHGLRDRLSELVPRTTSGLKSKAQHILVDISGTVPDIQQIKLMRSLVRDAAKLKPDVAPSAKLDPALSPSIS